MFDDQINNKSSTDRPLIVEGKNVCLKSLAHGMSTPNLDYLKAIKLTADHNDKLLDTLSKFNRKLTKICHNEDEIISDKYACLECNILAKEQLILSQLLENDNEFVVYTAQILLTRWLLLISNK
ncbi:18857_t:CDS:2, partial [Acaulospora morrowiae]